MSDNITLFATSESELELVLTTSGKYADTWHIEFSGPKSIVIPIHRKPDNCKKWYVGDKLNCRSEVLQLFIHFKLTFGC